jgi:integrase
MTLQLEQQEYLNFINSLRSPATITAYTKALRNYMQFIKTTNFSTLLKSSPKEIEAKIISYMVFQRQQKLSYSSIHQRLMAVKKFYEMNDVILNWKKVYQYHGERTRMKKDRAYTTKEIQQLLTKCDERMRVVVLLLASTGVRIGAIPDMKIKHITRIDRNSLYQIVVYENTSDEYYCFCSTECALAIDSYLDYRERCYEKITPDSPLIREKFNKSDPVKCRDPRHVPLNTLNVLMRNLLIDSGVQKPEHITESITNGKIKNDVMRNHGFRKFVETNMIRSKINAEAREMLLGHSIGLGNSYYRPHPDELLQEYLGCVNSLTINEENRLRIKLQETQVKHTEEWEWMRKKMVELEKRFSEKVV